MTGPSAVKEHTMAVRRIAWMIAVALAGCVSMGCGGSSPPEVSGGGPAPAAAQKSAAAPDPSKRNACAFVDRAAIEEMAGTSLTMLHDIQDEDRTVCELADPKSKIVVFSVTVHWKGGKELARVEQAGMSMAKQMLNDPDTDIMELTGSEKVRGLADKAFYSNIMPSWFLKGDVMVQIIAPTFDYQKTKQAFLSTAKKALSQL
jgi:hypothetical protein